MPLSSLGATQALLTVLANHASHTRDTQVLLSEISQVGRQLCDCDIVVTFAINPVTGAFSAKPGIAGDLSEHEGAHLNAPRPTGLTRQILNERTLFVPDLAAAEFEQYRSPFSEGSGIRAFAGVAVPTSDADPLAVMYFDFREPHLFSADEKAELKVFADQAALALQNLRLIDDLRRVSEMGQLLTRKLESDRVLKELVGSIRRAADADVAVLFRYDQENQYLMVPPEWDGELLEPSFPLPSALRHDDFTSGAFELRKPGFFSNTSRELYTDIRARRQSPSPTFVERERIESTAVIPLEVASQRVGVLFFNYRRHQRFEPAQQQVLQSLANYAAIAIQNAATFEGLRLRGGRRMAAMAAIERAMSATLDLEDVLQTIVDQSMKVVHSDETAVLLYDDAADALEVKAARGPGAEALRGHRILLAEAHGITRSVYLTGKPARVGDVRNDPEWRDLYVGSPDIAAELDVPLIHEGRVLGVMNYESRQPSAFSQDDEDFLVALAEHGVLAIRNAQAFARERRTAKANAALIDVAKTIVVETSVEAVFDVILERALALTGATSGEILEYNIRAGDLRQVAELGVPVGRDRHPLDYGVIGWVATQRRTFDGDITRSPWKELYVDLVEGTQSEMAVPIVRASGDLVGVIDVESRERHAFDGDDRVILEGLADLAVVAIQNAERYARAEAESSRFLTLVETGLQLMQIPALSEDALERAYQAVVQHATQFTRSEVVIRRYDRSSHGLVAVQTANKLTRPADRVATLDERSLNAQVFRERRTIAVDDALDPPPGIDVRPVDPSIRSILITPLGEGEDYYGNLGFSSPEPYRFSEADRKLCEGLARLLTATIIRVETARSGREAEDHTRTMEVLGSVGESAVELAHRLGGDLGKVELRINSRIKPGLVKSPDGAKASAELDTVIADVRKVLRMSTALQHEASQLARRPDPAAERPVVDLRDLLEYARESLSEMPKNIDLNVQLPIRGVPVSMRLEHGEQILHNLITNAVEAMPGGGRVTISTKISTSFVDIEVDDTGVGIEAADVDKIFRLFYSTKESSGFGLWSARTRARAAGGDLLVRSIRNRGSVFTLRVQRADLVSEGRVT